MASGRHNPMALDPDDQIKMAKESRAFGGDVPGRGPRCYRCGAQALVYGQDRKSGDPVTDNRCVRCSNAIFNALKRRGPILTPPPAAPPPVCKYCWKSKPLLGSWCGPCAIRHNELALERGETTKEQTEAAIAYFRGLMDGSIKRADSAERELENKETEEINDFYNQSEDEGYDGF